MYEERKFLDVACALYGGDIGLSNTRATLLKEAGRNDVPYVKNFRVRLTRIRRAILERDVFPTGEQAVLGYIRYGLGDLLQIVKTYAV